MSETHPLPTEITLHSGQRILSIAFDDGQRFELPCEYLRVFSPSAEVQGHHGVGAVLQVGKEAVNITDIQQIGQYAIKLFFDDNHRSGLFTWRYLYDLGANYQSHWADYLARLKQAGHHHRELDS